MRMTLGYYLHLTDSHETSELLVITGNYNFAVDVNASLQTVRPGRPLSPF